MKPVIVPKEIDCISVNPRLRTRKHMHQLAPEKLDV